MAEPDTAASPSSAPFEVVILGASMAGIEVYYQLRRMSAGRALSLCIIDKQVEHGYIPLVHERLVGRAPWPFDRNTNGVLPTARCVAPDPNARYVQDEVTSIELDGPVRSVRLRSGELIRGHSLVIALGSQLTAPPDLPGVEHLTRYKFDAELAHARALFSEARQRSGQQLVVIGGGVSGVELASELAHALQQQPTVAARVTLLQGASRLLPQLGASAARKAEQALLEQGVQLRLNTRVTRLDHNQLQLQSAGGAVESLAYDVVFWAAGVRPNPLLATFGLALTARGYLSVSPQLLCRAPDLRAYSGVYACGDGLRVVDEGSEWPTMQRAIECLWEAKLVARNLLRQRRGQTLRSHKLRSDFFYGVSLGARSLVAYGALSVHLGNLAVIFRRFLMWAYFRRYEKQIRITEAAQALPARLPAQPVPAAAEHPIDVA